MTQTPLDPDLIRKAFNAIRGDHWPDDLQAALDHPVRGKVILARARTMALGINPPERKKPSNRGVSPPQNAIPDQSTPRTIDRKSRAAGERDDD